MKINLFMMDVKLNIILPSLSVNVNHFISKIFRKFKIFDFCILHLIKVTKFSDRICILRRGEHVNVFPLFIFRINSTNIFTSNYLTGTHNIGKQDTSDTCVLTEFVVKNAKYKLLPLPSKHVSHV